MSVSPDTVDGTPISRLAFGATGTGTAEQATPEKDASRINLFRSAFELGINVFDTAELYGGGYSEILLGRAFSHCRESVFICTKFNPDNASAIGIAQAVEGSLRRLGTDYIDLYQLHWPSPFVPFEESWNTLSRLLEEGKIRFFGVGNCSYEELLNYEFLSGGKITSVELPFNIAEPEIAKPFLSWACNAEKRLFAYSPLGQGRLCHSHSKTPILLEISERHSISENQLALAWVMSHSGTVPVFQTSSLNHLRDNLAGASISLNQKEIKELENAYATPPREIRLSQVRIGSLDGREGYSSCEEALSNLHNWIPSPALLAERIRRGGHPPPLRLVKPNVEGLYCLDSYDFGGEMKKYWAWRLASDEDAKVLAYIFDSQRKR